jgi:hypothetical protein
MVSGARRGLITLSTVIAAGALASTAEGAVLERSTFDTGPEGWKVVGDTGSGTENPSFVSSGGDPGGYISIDDAVAGGTMYWRAPRPFRTAARDAFGGTFLYSQRQSVNVNQFDEDDFVLEGDGLRLVYNQALNPPPAPEWGKFRVRFAKAGWFNETSGLPATNADMKNAIESLDALLIRAEFVSGPDVDDLDSVSMRSKPAG